MDTAGDLGVKSDLNDTTFVKHSSSSSSRNPRRPIWFRWWFLSVVVIVSILSFTLRIGSLTTFQASSYESWNIGGVGIQQKILESLLLSSDTTSSSSGSSSSSMGSNNNDNVKAMDPFRPLASHSNTTASHHKDLPYLSIIPKPTKLQQSLGTFELSASTKICISDEDAQPEAEFLAETLRASTGLPLPLHNGCEQGHICFLMLEDEDNDATANKGNDNDDEINMKQEKEAYVLDVRDSGAVIGAFTRVGLFHGLQTLLQLLPPQVYLPRPQVPMPAWTIPHVHVEDAPRFAWRGMHLDVARHFHSKDFVLKFIQLMSIHKFNSLHLHLTEDQGWRVEIKRYPLLTNISAWRNETVVGNMNDYKGGRPLRYDGKRHGGFFTQEDIKEMVAYAARRHINVVPEIEMPGHTESVFAAYPEYTCQSHRHYYVKREWGVSDNVYCVGNEKTFEFLENVLTEVLELFPSPYIHVGGDECPKVHWNTCPKCQARMKEEGLTHPMQLQSYLIKRMERFLNDKGRQLIGWDEIFEGGLAPNAAVMSWRGTDPAKKAALASHDTILAPVGETYFDWYQAKKSKEPLAWGGFTPLDKVYAYDPMPPRLPKDKEKHILGAQGQLWTEYMPTSNQVEYMAFPRAVALAESVWMKRGKDYEDFYNRLTKGHLARLDALNVNYRKPTTMYEKEY